MRSTFAGLNTVVRGLYAQQVGLDTVGHNVSNASTDGYSRQVVNLATTTPGTIYGAHGKMQIGTGVDITSIRRTRDAFIDKQFWKETSTLGYAQTKEKTLSNLEGIFREPSDSGLQTTLNKFWNAWQTLSANASDNGARTLVRQRGVDLVDSIKSENDKLKNMAADINSTLKIKVDQVNQYTSEIASLNHQITRIEVGNDYANDLRDRRDYLVDQLSSLMKVSVSEDKYGNYTVQSAGATLVDGDKNLKLTTATDYGAEIYTKYGLQALKVVTEDGHGLQFSETGGEIKALLDSRDSNKATSGSGFGVVEYMNQLNTISKFLMKDFNEVHRAGYGTDDSTMSNFFGDGSNGAVSNATFNSWNDAWAQSQGGWVNALKVNTDFFTSDGLKYIAAKNQPGGAVVPVKSNAASGTMTVNGSYVGTSPGNYIVRTDALGLGSSTVVTQSDTSGGAAKLSGTYSGAGTTNYTVRIDTFDTGTGKVTGASYSTDGGTTWTAGTIDNSTTPPTFSLSLGVKIAMANNSKNSSGDTYSFSVSPASNDRVTGVSYSTDGGTTWTTGKIDNSTSPPAFQLSQGVRVTTADNSGNLVGDTYTFTVKEGYASGGNAVKLAERLKTDKVVTLGNSSLDSYYAATIGTLGTDAQSAQKFTDNQATLVNQVLNWRESVSGVNVDEELTNMIRFQKGYNSAARVLTTMDEMLDKLINGTGVVGR